MYIIYRVPIVYHVPTNNYYCLFLLKGKRRFTFFSRQKKSKSKMDAKKESKKEKGKSDAGSKMRDEGKKEKKEPKSKRKQKKKNRKKDRKNMSALMIGLDAAGKTSILTS